MRQKQTIAAMAVAGLAASAGLSNPADISSAFGPSTATSSASWLTYIGGFMGPSNIAPTLTDAPVRVEQSLNSMLFFTLAGPGNTPGAQGATFNFDIGGFGDDPGAGGSNEFTPVAGPDLIVSLQTADEPAVVTHRVDQSTESGPGGFQVAVPLPSAGVLAAGGLAFVAIRRRRR